MRSKLGAAVILGLVVAAAATRAAERDPFDDPQWPNLDLGGPQWPNVKLDDAKAPRVNPQPAFVKPIEVENRSSDHTSSIAAKSSSAPKPNPTVEGRDAYASEVAKRWPALPPEKPQPSPFVFEAGARYWYSTGSINFGFSNGSPLFGSPTSTLDWHGLTAHSGEVFARLDHMPSGFFVKGIFGAGTVVGGNIEDRDFLVGQFKFSDTTSNVSNGDLTYAMFDVGWAYSPSREIRLGFFAGYHYWREKVTANGLVCNQDSFIGCSNGSILVDFNTPVGTYEPTWHAVRIGVESKVWVDEHWSFSGEIAGIPYAALQNKDGHLLRQGMDDLGPAPNVITDSKYAYGVESELFVNYAVTPNIEIGGGVRYWGLASRSGGVTFGPYFGVSDPLKNFDQQRYGVLLHVKGIF